MTHGPTPEWMREQERSHLGALRLMVWISLRLGRPIGRLVLHGIALYFVLFSPKARRNGRAYLARDGSPGRPQAHADALLSARAWLPLGLHVLWLDTAPHPQPPAQEVARAMGARYLPLPHADARQVAQLVNRVTSGP